MKPEAIVTESLQQYLLRTGQATPRFLQGAFPFIGAGITERVALADEAEYTVPEYHKAEVLYLRAGNHTESLIYLTLCANNRPVRYFPLGKSEAMHIPLAIVETHPAGTKLTLQVSAARGESGLVIVDLGLLEFSL
nr:hypothetical protein [Armatimonas sp.]